MLELELSMMRSAHSVLDKSMKKHALECFQAVKSCRPFFNSFISKRVRRRRQKYFARETVHIVTRQTVAIGGDKSSSDTHCAICCLHVFCTERRINMYPLLQFTFQIMPVYIFKLCQFTFSNYASLLFQIML